MSSSVIGGPANGELKKDHIELRVSSSAKELIQRVMAASGLTADDLAYKGVRCVPDAHQHEVLTGADRDAFLAVVRDPPEPADRLVAALRRHRDLFG